MSYTAGYTRAGKLFNDKCEHLQDFDYKTVKPKRKAWNETIAGLVEGKKTVAVETVTPIADINTGYFVRLEHKEGLLLVKNYDQEYVNELAYEPDVYTTMELE